MTLGEFIYIQPFIPQQPTQVGQPSGVGAPVLVCERPEQALDLVAEACRSLGLMPGKEIRLALNCAAHRLMDYVRSTRPPPNLD